MQRSALQSAVRSSLRRFRSSPGQRGNRHRNRAAEGTHGYSPEKNDGFHVEVVNQFEGAQRAFIGTAHFTKSHGRRSLRNPEPDRARKSLVMIFHSKQSGITGCIRIRAFRNSSTIRATDYGTPEERAKADRQVS